MPRLLTDDEIAVSLQNLPGWTHHDGAIHATYTFRDFAAAFRFMTTVAAAAERHDHHPDWRNCWSRVDITLRTHDAAGVTESDLTLARTIQQLADTAR